MQVAVRPGVAPLTVEAFPVNLASHVNLSSSLAEPDWNAIRKAAYKRANYRCTAAQSALIHTVQSALTCTVRSALTHTVRSASNCTVRSALTHTVRSALAHTVRSASPYTV